MDKVKEFVENINKLSCNYLIDIANEEDGYNMLHFAVCYKRINILKFLIDYMEPVRLTISSVFIAVKSSCCSPVITGYCKLCMTYICMVNLWQVFYTKNLVQKT